MNALNELIDKRDDAIHAKAKADFVRRANRAGGDRSDAPQDRAASDKLDAARYIAE